MFFNSKRFEIVDLNNRTILELNKVNTLSFYIRDVLLDTAIDSLYYQVIKKSGRDEVLVGAPVQITDITGNVAEFSYTPTDATMDTISFRIRIIDADASEHISNIDSYSVKS